MGAVAELLDNRSRRAAGVPYGQAFRVLLRRKPSLRRVEHRGCIGVEVAALSGGGLPAGCPGSVPALRFPCERAAEVAIGDHRNSRRVIRARLAVGS